MEKSTKVTLAAGAAILAYPGWLGFVSVVDSVVNPGDNRSREPESAVAPIMPGPVTERTPEPEATYGPGDIPEYIYGDTGDTPTPSPELTAKTTATPKPRIGGIACNGVIIYDKTSCDVVEAPTETTAPQPTIEPTKAPSFPPIKPTPKPPKPTHTPQPQPTFEPLPTSTPEPAPETTPAPEPTAAAPNPDGSPNFPTFPPEETSSPQFVG